MTPRSSGPGAEYAPLRGTTNLRLTANQHCKCNGKLRWRSCGHHFPSQPGRGSATDCLGHSRKADLVNFSQAPKRPRCAGRCADVLGTGNGLSNWCPSPGWRARSESTLEWPLTPPVMVTRKAERHRVENLVAGYTRNAGSIPIDWR